MKQAKNKIKAVFFDIDGTFYDHETNAIKASSIEAVKELKKQGYKIALCTGRPFEMAKELPVLEGIDWDGFIGSAGGVIYDENYEELQRDAYTKEQLQRIFAIADELQIALYINGNEAFLTIDDKEAKEVLEQFHVQVPVVRGYQKDDKIEMISMFKGYDFDYSRFLEIPGIALQKSSGVIMDLVKKGVHKASGIQLLMKYWGLQGEGYLAFGDSMNDVEMIQEATIGVVMKNGDSRLLPYADIVCGASYEDSIYECLKDLSMI